MNFTTLILLIFTAILAIGLVSKGLTHSYFRRDAGELTPANTEY